jgi:hypothetical protein
MREYLPLTPLTSPALHLYTNLSNFWPAEALDGNSMEAMFDEFFGLLAKP